MELLNSQYLPQKPVFLIKVEEFLISHQLPFITCKYYVNLFENYLGFTSITK